MCVGFKGVVPGVIIGSGSETCSKAQRLINTLGRLPTNTYCVNVCSVLTYIFCIDLYILYLFHEYVFSFLIAPVCILGYHVTPIHEPSIYVMLMLGRLPHTFNNCLCGAVIKHLLFVSVILCDVFIMCNIHIIFNKNCSNDNLIVFVNFLQLITVLLGRYLNRWTIRDGDTHRTWTHKGHGHLQDTDTYRTWTHKGHRHIQDMDTYRTWTHKGHRHIQDMDTYRTWTHKGHRHIQDMDTYRTWTLTGHGHVHDRDTYKTWTLTGHGHVHDRDTYKTWTLTGHGHVHGSDTYKTWRDQPTDRQSEIDRHKQGH